MTKIDYPQTVRPNNASDMPSLREDDDNLGSRRGSIVNYITIPNILAASLCFFYAYLFYQDIAQYWFHPHWTTDDALQQLVPLHAVFDPDIFQDDLIIDTMKGYLAPLHYWTSYFFTYLSGSPIMAGHWVMLLQIVLTLYFLFFAVKEKAGIAPAFISVAWLLHTRPFMQRITGGLPRGWGAVILCGYLFFAFRKNNKGMFILLLCGCLLHPPATLMIAAAYGLLLFWKVLNKQSRPYYIKAFLVLLITSPFYAGLTWKIVQRPPEVGQMVDYETALTLPEMRRPRGRFPFTPLDKISTEIRSYAYQPFLHRLYNPPRFWKRTMRYWILGFVFLLGVAAGFRKRQFFHSELTTLFLSIVSIYTLSRLFAFKLYVPNRHLQLPMAAFLIPFFCIAVWNTFKRNPDLGSKLKDSYLSVFVFALLGGLVWIGTGDGLYGTANFNYSLDKKGKVFSWIEKNTKRDAYFAGHPSHVDGLPLFAKRRTFATTETAHPFYQVYFKEVKRRLIISFKAHYSKSLVEFYKILEAENIDYFVFNRKKFYPEELKKERYFEPLDPIVKELASYDYKSYVYKKLPSELTERIPFLVFKDNNSAVVDVSLLGEYLKTLARETNSTIDELNI